MRKFFSCCEKCIENIGRHSTNAAKFWMDLCCLCQEEGNLLHFDNQDFPELRALEILGYVVSTDKENVISVKLLGNNQNFFCTKDGLHE